MEAREAKALHIAAVNKLEPKNGRWLVPSQSGNGAYTVAVGRDEAWHCDCPDFEERQMPCKHVIAVTVTCQREYGNGSKITYSETVKITYRQDWPAYNKAQTNEKRMVMAMLAELCRGIATDQTPNSGRPRLPLGDMVFAGIAKVFSGMSARRFATDLSAAHDDGLIGSVPSYNSVLRYMQSPEMTPILSGLVELSALPLQAIEKDFAVDSSGFGTSTMRTWFSQKHGREVTGRTWRKAHVIAGVRTHVVTACVVTAPTVNDAPLLPELVNTTAKNFDVQAVMADKGYLSRNNAAEIEAVGADPFIAFKSNTVEPKPASAWARMWHMFAYRADEYLDRYHERSNVETVFHMLKSKFGDTLLAKSDDGQTNEVLAKIVCHNLCCLVQAFYELGIESEFGSLPV